MNENILKKGIKVSPPKSIEVEIKGAKVVTLKGDKGDVGPKGDIFADGVVTIRGNDGKDGEQGITGAIGKQGAKGDTGPRGLQGDRGEQGEKGEIGFSGKDGEKGKDGTDGSPDTAEQIIEKISPLKNALDFRILKNIPDFVMSKDIGHDQGGGGGSIIRYNDSTGAQISQNVSAIQYGSGLTPSYSNGTITITASGGGGSAAAPINAIQFNNPLGTFAGDANFTYVAGTGLNVGGTPGTGNVFLGGNGAEIVGTNNTLAGTNLIVQNKSNGTKAFVDLFLQNDLADATGTHYAVVNLNSSGYTDTTFGTIFAVVNQLQVYGTDGPTTIGTTKAGTYLNFFTGGNATTNEKMRITDTGVMIGGLGLTSMLTTELDAIANVSTDGIILQNTTASTVGVPVQRAPRIRMTGTALNSTSGLSETDGWIIESLPQSVAGATTSNLSFSVALNGGGFSNKLILNSAGALISSATTSTSFQSSNTFFSSNFGTLGNAGNTTTTAGLLFAGASTIGYRFFSNGSTTATPGAGNPYASFILGSGNAVTIAGSGINALFTQMVINPLTINAGAGTLTASASLYLNGAATGAVSNYVLYSASGLSLFEQDAIATTPTDVLLLRNITAAANGAQQDSPALNLQGSGWASTGGTSQTWNWRIYVVPVQGTTNSSSTLNFDVSRAGGAYGAEMSLGNSGFLSLSNAIQSTVANITTTSTDGMITRNNTAATNGVQVQYSPRIRLTGAGWNTGGAASETDDWIVENRPAAGNPTTSTLNFQSQINAGGYVNNFILTNAGDAKLNTVGGGLYVKEGSNATMGTGTLSGGTLVVSTTKVTANSRIFLADQGGTVTNIGSLYVSARSAGTSFTVSSSNVLDASTFAWIIFEPS